MNKIVNKYLLAGDKLMPELHLRQPGFAYSVCGAFTKHRERIQIFRKTGDLKHLYRNELDKACFDHDAAYSNSKDLAKRTIADKILKNRAYGIAKNPKYDGYRRGLASIVCKFFDKKTGFGASVNEELPQELYKPLIKKSKRRKVYARFKGKIWAADLAGMGSFSSFDPDVKYLLCFIDVFSFQFQTVLHGFIEIVNESEANQINYRLIKKKKLTIALCKNG